MQAIQQGASRDLLLLGDAQLLVGTFEELVAVLLCELEKRYFIRRRTLVSDWRVLFFVRFARVRHTVVVDGETFEEFLCQVLLRGKIDAGFARHRLKLEVAPLIVAMLIEE